MHMFMLYLFQQIQHCSRPIAYYAMAHMLCMAMVAMCHIGVLKCTRTRKYLVSMALSKHLESGFLPEYVTSIHVADAESK